MRPLVVCIKAYNRPRSLLHLLRDVARWRPRSSPFSLFVFDDASSSDMSAARAFCEEQGWAWRRQETRHGKKLAWSLTNKIFDTVKQQIERATRSLVFFFDDDMRLCRNFFDRALGYWEDAPGNARVTLHFMVDAKRKVAACWTDVRARDATDKVRIIQWVDGSFMCDRGFFDQLCWKVEPISEARWQRDSTCSTGVGMQISKRLHARKCILYQTRQSLVVHAKGKSHLNPEVRASQPMRTVDFIDGNHERNRLEDSGTATVVQASLATIPARQKGLEKVIASLVPQVDLLRVYLNGYGLVPEFLNLPSIIVVRSQDHGDVGDRGKFHWADGAQGYQLTCDDDIIYPANYAGRMIDAIERYKRKAVIGLHGITLNPDMQSYYRSRSSMHFVQELKEDKGAHLVGTGCMAYHVDTLRVRLADFRSANMADLWFGLLCQKQKVPVVAMERPAGWLTRVPTKSSIYERARKDDAEQTKIVKTVWPWKVHPA